MINLVAVRVSELLRRKKFPHATIVYGPEPFVRVPSQTQIIFARDLSAGDTLVAPRGQSRNSREGRGRYLFHRQVGGECWVLAKATRVGATHADHELLCDRYVDGIQCSLYEFSTSHQYAVAVGRGAYVYGAELPGEFAQFPGVVYRFSFSVSRGVFDADFDDKGLSEHAIDEVTSGSKVHLYDITADGPSVKAPSGSGETDDQEEQDEP